MAKVDGAEKRGRAWCFIIENMRASVLDRTGGWRDV
jgi:hypothetical protein